MQARVVAADAGPATTSTITLSAACDPGNVSPATISSVTSGANPAEVVRLEGTIFYVGKRADIATNSSPLFRRELSATVTAGVDEAVP